MYIVALDKIRSVYIATWSGDPGRTCVKDSAKRFDTMSRATYSLANARRYHDFLDAEIIDLDKE